MQISQERYEVIKHKVSELHNKIYIKNYSINAESILKKYFSDNCFITRIPYNDNDDADVVMNYYPDNDIYGLSINELRDKPYWSKRLNLSFSHEIGHIELLHKDLVNTYDIDIEDEAYEFGRQFLIPEDELFKTPLNIDIISNKFNVSHNAVKIRLEVLEKDCKFYCRPECEYFMKKTPLFKKYKGLEAWKQAAPIFEKFNEGE